MAICYGEKYQSTIPRNAVVVFLTQEIQRMHEEMPT